MQNKQKGTEFEVWIKRACEAYHKYALKDRNITIKHNVNLKSKSVATCQFDLYWEDKGITTITYAVECKNHKTKISVNYIRDFADKLKDCNISKGILISSNGFQKGTIKVAKSAGIDLFIIRQPTRSESIELDFNGLNFQDSLLGNSFGFSNFDMPFMESNYFSNGLWGYGNINNLSLIEPKPNKRFNPSKVHSILTKIPSVKYYKEDLYSSIIIYKSNDDEVYCDTRQHAQRENIRS